MRCPPTCCFSFSQLAPLGHDGSEGRWRRPEDFANGTAACSGLKKRGHRTGRRGIAAKRLSKLLLFIPAYVLARLRPGRRALFTPHHRQEPSTIASMRHPRLLPQTEAGWSRDGVGRRSPTAMESPISASTGNELGASNALDLYSPKSVLPEV